MCLFSISCQSTKKIESEDTETIFFEYLEYLGDNKYKLTDMYMVRKNTFYNHSGDYKNFTQEQALEFYIENNSKKDSLNYDIELYFKGYDYDGYDEIGDKPFNYEIIDFKFSFDLSSIRLDILKKDYYKNQTPVGFGEWNYLVNISKH